jgi:16S rRNA (guanine527-N7)-methyltransferase
MLTDDQVDQLLSYAQLLSKWGRVYNLTNLLEPHDILTHHLLDCLAVLPSLDAHFANNSLKEGECAELLDVGSGAGLPGVVLAIVRPNWRVRCIDSVAKKTAFVLQAALELGLTQLKGVHGRAEGLSVTAHVVVSRAFASLSDFVASTGHMIQGDRGVWLAMKGVLPIQEIAALPEKVRAFHVEQLKIPGLEAERCLVWMRRGDQAHVNSVFVDTTEQTRSVL